MNTKEREIISEYYRNYIQNGMRGDPVGGFSDLRDLFEELRKNDKKLDTLLQEVYDEIPERLY